jgi:hypothetical protein
MNGEDGCSPKKETKFGVLLVKEANDQLANQALILSHNFRIIGGWPRQNSAQ